jgi:hypothetical protein
MCLADKEFECWENFTYFYIKKFIWQNFHSPHTQVSILELQNGNLNTFSFVLDDNHMLSSLPLEFPKDMLSA